MELNIQLGRLWKHNELAYLLLSTSCVKRCWFILKVSHRDWISYQFFTINIPKYKISHFCYWIVIVTSRILNAQAEVEPVSLLVVWHGKLDNHNFGCFTTKEGREWQTTNPLIWLITYSLLPSPPPPPKYALHETYWSEKGLIRQKFSRERDTSYTVIWKLTQKVTRETWLRNVDCVTERTDDALVNMYSSKTNDDFFKLRSFWCSLLYLILTMTLAVKWNDSAPDHDEVGYTAVGTVRFYVFSFIIGSLSWNLLKVT